MKTPNRLGLLLTLLLAGALPAAQGRAESSAPVFRGGSSTENQAVGRPPPPHSGGETGTGTHPPPLPQSPLPCNPTEPGKVRLAIEPQPPFYPGQGTQSPVYVGQTVRYGITSERFG
ncbi:MAG: hypothetical protein HQL37_15065, partial [Alphaproteobacteria bacterium]|nr:hypothetical protein [Alphaproteobacteria bacterium]